MPKTETQPQTEGRSDKKPMLVLLGFWSAIAIGLIALLSGPAYKYELVSLSGAFQGITTGAIGSVVTGLLCLVGLIILRGKIDSTSRGMLITGLAVSVVVAGIIWSLFLQAKTVPPIHDISTDMQTPPEFQALAEARELSPNGIEYGGPAIAAQQAAAYPDIQPLTLSLSPREALVKATAAAEAMGWKIADVSAADMRLEATDTTFWFGFKDDVVIRISPRDEGSRLDIRSMSRVGMSDVGANAERIRKFAEKLGQQ